ncbi:MAG: 1-acyl-sn-glycerol-3-phosphate acyltransferase [Coriobacteriaceae bacterium]|jgi:1-acyl-sn-glycerol-3-phosphate acyltransferase|nr:1-acyl-sn-glycerol-3-phosphate acyltransferase [Coriobacteriaceae bacterium]
MSLFLSREELWDRPLGGISRERELPHWSGNILFILVAAICKLCFRYRVEGKANLAPFARRKGVVVVCNHTSYLDTVFVYLAARPKQWVRLMGRESLFEAGHGFVGQLLSRVGAFPVKRDSADLSAVKRASRMLKNGEAVGIFPEGTRRGKGSQSPEIHAGAAFVARMAKAPILPMTVRNAELVKQKGRFIRFPKITVEYGLPVLVGDFDFLPKEERLEACSWYCMRECFALSARIAPEQVDMAALFPGAKDYTEAFRQHPVPSHSSQAVCQGTAWDDAHEASQ